MLPPHLVACVALLYEAVGVLVIPPVTSMPVSSPYKKPPHSKGMDGRTWVTTGRYGLNLRARPSRGACRTWGRTPGQGRPASTAGPGDSGTWSVQAPQDTGLGAPALSGQQVLIPCSELRKRGRTPSSAGLRLHEGLANSGGDRTTAQGRRLPGPHLRTGSSGQP